MTQWDITTIDCTDAHAVSDVRSVLHAYHDELVATFPANTLTGEIESLPAPYLPPAGALLVARNGDGRPVGCVGLKRFTEHECEITRLYVLAEARRSGLGRALVRAAMDQARAMGYREMLLIAVTRTTETAQRIYRELGFEDSPPYRETPLGYDLKHFSFMRCTL